MLVFSVFFLLLLVGGYKICGEAEVVEMGGEGGGASRKFRRAAKKIFVQTCGSFCQTQQPHLDTSSATTVSLSLSTFLKRPAGNFQFLILVPRLSAFYQWMCRQLALALKEFTISLQNRVNCLFLF